MAVKTANNRSNFRSSKVTNTIEAVLVRNRRCNRCKMYKTASHITIMNTHLKIAFNAVKGLAEYIEARRQIANRDRNLTTVRTADQEEEITKIRGQLLTAQKKAS